MKFATFLFSIVLFMACSNFNKAKVDNHVVKYYLLNGDSVSITSDADSGFRESLSVIKDSRENGLYKKYYENGRTNEIGLMQDGRKIGLWMTFDRDSNLLQASHFFNDTMLVELDKTDFNFMTKKISECNCRFSIPATWKEETFDKKDNILHAVHKLCDSVQFCPNFVIGVYNEVSSSFSFSSFIDSYSKNAD